MIVLVINSGSSSIKFQLLDMKDERQLVNGLVERIGEENGHVKCIFWPNSENMRKKELEKPIHSHEDGMILVADMLTGSEVLAGTALGAIGHRVVHGGESFHTPTLIDDAVMQAIEESVPLAPLHNSPSLDVIKVALELFADIPQVVVFDTAFHQTIPAHAYTYAIPYEMYEKYRVRRYGFHGTSHKYVAGECARLLGKKLEESNLITIHLGNGCSMTAIKQGKSVDTSFGLTPLEGLVMGTRSGDIDPAVHAFLARNTGMTIEDIDSMLNKQSGMKGICGLNDLRDIHDAIAAGNELASLALEIQTYRNKKYIGGYMAVLGQVDSIVFTAGIGENDWVVRSKSLEGLEPFGVILDEEINNQRVKKPLCISSSGSRVKVWVIPTNEELAIARETKRLVE